VARRAFHPSPRRATMGNTGIAVALGMGVTVLIIAGVIKLLAG
jgi:hypothetical protein